VIVGLDRADDAGVYRINNDLAIIQTVDFFTPIVDDPYRFGQIAAANALSDVYAMGGEPKTAMNLVAFPLKQMDIGILRSIIEGGIDKLKEAGVVLIGGHSVADNELKYGLSVTGFIHPDRILTKKNMKEGNRLVITKPIGTGIVNTAIKRGAASEETIESVTRVMSALNRDAADVMTRFPVNACTDITGFGLLGHIAEMVEGSGVGVELKADMIPVFEEARGFAGSGMMPGGLHNNRKFRENMVEFDASVDLFMRDVMFDPQTSGGLLISVEEESVGTLLAGLREKGIPVSANIGKVVSGVGEKIIVK